MPAGRDADALQRPAFLRGFFRNHIVAFEQRHLIGGENRIGQEAQNLSLNARRPERDRQENALAADHLQCPLHTAP